MDLLASDGTLAPLYAGNGGRAVPRPLATAAIRR